VMQLNGQNVAFSKFGGTGVDGALTITSGTTTINLGGASVFVKNYSSISITGTTSKLAFSNPASTGTIIVLKSQGNVTITSTNSPAIDITSMGAAGGAAGSSTGGSQQGGGGGGGASAAGNGVGSSGIINTTNGPGNPGSVYAGWLWMMMTAATSAQATNTPGLGGTINIPTVANSAKYVKICVIPGGGAAAGQDGSTGHGGAGAVGAGALYIECAGALNITAIILASGGTGSNGAGNGGGGGGGGGGSIVILYNTLTANTGTYTVTGGSPGNSAGAGAGGFYLVAQNTEFA